MGGSVIDGVNIVWSVADGIRLPVDWCLSAMMEDTVFKKQEWFDLAGQPVETGYLKYFPTAAGKICFMVLAVRPKSM